MQVWFPTPRTKNLIGGYNDSMDTMQVLMEWSAPEHEHREKGKVWNIGLAVVVIGSATLALIADNGLLAFILVLGGFMVGILGQRQPKDIPSAIREDGVQMGSTVYFFRSLESFWLTKLNDPEEKNLLLLRSQKAGMPLITVPISDEVQLRELQELMLEMIPEEEMREPFFHKVIDYFGL